MIALPDTVEHPIIGGRRYRTPQEQIGPKCDCHACFPEEENVQVILLWAVPAVIVIGGGGYRLMHLHH